MKVLAISPLDKDATVSILEDGRVLFAAGEERFTRNKQQDGFPARAIEAGLAYTGLRLDDLDIVAYPFLRCQDETKLIMGNLEQEERFLTETPFHDMKRQIGVALDRVPARRHPIPGLPCPNDKMEKSPLHRMLYRWTGLESSMSRMMAKRESRSWGRAATECHRQWQAELEGQLKSMGLLEKLKRYDHHAAHAAAAYLASGFERALIVTLDGYGTGLAGSVSLGEGNRIRRLHRLEYPHSFGTFYESVTASLGFKPGRHEGKIVGLAAYGEPKVLLDLLLSRVQQEPGNFRILESNNVYFSRYLASLFPKVDMAAAYQTVLELVVANYIRHYVEQTGVDTVVLAGGVVANVKLNQRIFEIPAVRRISIYPNMGDGGCGTGAGLLASQGCFKEPIPYETVYFGPEYSDQAIAQELEAAGLPFEKIVPIEPVIAGLIHDGQVVARFNGRMEYGPRSLGNRSILYRASEPEVNQWLNQRLGRTEFMPFAPATLYEKRHQCYNNIDGAEYTAQFMTITFDCTEFMKRSCPAAVHVDGTARPQLVRRETNPSYYQIIQEYYKLSGVPSVINTSFNMHEEPIVNTPSDAIRAFIQGNLDYLAIHNFLVRNPACSRRESKGTAV